MNEQTPETYEKLGQHIVDMFGLKIKRHNGRVDTSWGDKSLEGLGRTIERVVKDATAN